MNELPKNELLVEAEGLAKVYRGRRVVTSVTMNIRAGEVVGLLGPNGAGKTTSFYMVMGLVRPNEGTIKFRDVDITHMPMYQRARLGMGYLAQEPSIFRKPRSSLTYRTPYPPAPTNSIFIITPQLPFSGCYQPHLLQ